MLSEGEFCKAETAPNKNHEVVFEERHKIERHLNIEIRKCAAVKFKKMSKPILSHALAKLCGWIISMQFEGIAVGEARFAHIYLIKESAQRCEHGREQLIQSCKGL
jgi:hypothetical protein